MNLILRMIWVGVAAFFRGRLEPEDTGRVSQIVFPNDLDLNLHMNNGRYLTIMDLGRVDLLIRIGLVKIMWEEGWVPVIGAIHTTFRRSLYAFQRFEIVTNIVGWDEKWIYMIQSIERDGHQIATAVMKTLFVSKGKKITTQQLLERLGKDPVSPEIPGHVLQLMKIE